MSNFAQSHESKPELGHSVTAQPLEIPPAESRLPNYPLCDQKIACMLVSEDSKESITIEGEVRKKVLEWTGRTPHEGRGSLFLAAAKTLILTPAQHLELLELIKKTPLAAFTVAECVDAIERGMREEAPRIGRSIRLLNAAEYCLNAGRALAASTVNSALPRNEQLSLALDIWNGMILLQDFAAAMLRNFREEVRDRLIEQAKSVDTLTLNANIPDAVNKGIQAEVVRQTREFANTSTRIKEVQAALVPLAKALLALPSPIVKAIAYSQIETNCEILGKALGLYGTDPEPTLAALEDWKAFLDYHIPLLSRYFEETATQKEPQEQSSNEQADSPWDVHWKIYKKTAALLPLKCEETVISVFLSGFCAEWREHLWGVRLIGVPGPVGDRAFEIVSEIVENAAAEAYKCRAAYGQTLLERDRWCFAATAAWRRDAAADDKDKVIGEMVADQASNLVHGITDLILENLSLSLPKHYGPLPCDPKKHLERTMTLIEGALSQSSTSPGLYCAAQSAARTLATSLDSWDYVAVLDDEPELAFRAKKLFEDAKVVPCDNWGNGLQQRGILPPAKTLSTK